MRRGEFPGGHDEIRLDLETGMITCSLQGAPHRRDGAAVTWHDEEGLQAAYWLYGRQVSRVQVWRGMADDSGEFDASFTAGWEQAMERFRAAELRSLIETGDELDRMLRFVPTDEDARRNAYSAAFFLGQAEAAVRLRREWIIALFEGRDVDDLDDALDGALDHE